MYTIRDLCRISKLSRSTLLYYDALGLLKPAERSGANYRVYTEESLLRLAKICLYRDAGVSLYDIAALVGAPENSDLNLDILEKTLYLLSGEINKLRDKQKIIVDLIKAAKNVNSTAGGVSPAEEEARDEELQRRLAGYAFNVYEYVRPLD
jgi:DNA-binding transcriptional MerR regulator